MGVFAISLFLAIGAVVFLSRGVGTVGVPPGKQLRYFAAPLASSTLEGDVNLNPPCVPRTHDPRALNVCLLARRGPLVLAFFVTNSDPCKRQVDALQAVSRTPLGRRAQLAAVAIRASHRTTAALVRARHWTIPVAYDRVGAIGSLFGVEVCPLVELAYRGGIVAQRLIGSHWVSAPALAPRIRSLVGG